MIHDKFDAQELDSSANEFTLKCMAITTAAFALVWIFTLLRVFIVDASLMTIIFIAASVIMLAPSLICRFTGTDKWWIKYMILLCSVLATTLTGCVLSFHSVLLFALPLIFSAQYSKRGVAIYTYILTAVGMFASVMANYYIGITDANMLVLTNNTTEYYMSLPDKIALNEHPWATLPRFFVLPRCMILLVFVPVIRNISDNIAKTAARTALLVHETETDKMTRFYNKGKYDDMVKNYYPHLDTAAVVFWDVNNLKFVNDTYGHALGDFLITAIADIIRIYSDDTHKVYRVGGDEFIMIIENPEPDEAQNIAARCGETISKRSSYLQIPISASAGCSTGRASEIADLINQADENMYKAKRESKKGREQNSTPPAKINRKKLIGRIKRLRSVSAAQSDDTEK